MSDRDPIEMSAIDPILGVGRRELEALQLERLRFDAQPRLCEQSVLPPQFRCRGRRPAGSALAATTWPVSRSPPRRICERPIHTASSPFRWSRIARVHASSGTTGKPTVVGYTRDDIATWSNLVARSIRAAGGRRGMKVHVAYGYGLFTGGLGAHYGAEAAGCTVIPMSGGQTERQVQLIMDFATRDHHGDAELHAGHPGRIQAPRHRSEIERAAHRHLRRRTVGRGDPQ